MNVSFTTEEKDSVEFNSDGDVLAHYDIMNFQRNSDNTFSYVKIGDWKNHTLNFSGDIKPPNGTAKFSSVCSKPCPAGSYKVIKDRSNNSHPSHKKCTNWLNSIFKNCCRDFYFIRILVPSFNFYDFHTFYRFSKRLAEPSRATVVGCAWSVRQINF